MKRYNSGLDPDCWNRMMTADVRDIVDAHASGNPRKLEQAYAERVDRMRIHLARRCPPRVSHATVCDGSLLMGGLPR